MESTLSKILQEKKHDEVSMSHSLESALQKFVCLFVQFCMMNVVREDMHASKKSRLPVAFRSDGNMQNRLT